MIFGIASSCRFHSLGEFDDTKRSCRKRLDGHNRRRRKPQPDPLNPGGLFANNHGKFIPPWLLAGQSLLFLNRTHVYCQSATEHAYMRNQAQGLGRWINYKADNTELIDGRKAEILRLDYDYYLAGWHKREAQLIINYVIFIFCELSWGTAYWTLRISILHLIDHMLNWVLTCQLIGSTMPQIISHTASAKCYNQMFFLTMKVGGKGTCLVLVLVLHYHDEPRLLFESNRSLV